MKKYIITRLGLDFPQKNKNNNKLIHENNNSHYMDNVINILLNFTYMCVKNQTCEDKHWIFFTGRRFNDDFKNIIENTIVDIPIQFLKDTEYCDIKKPWENDEDKILFRLDADDYMHPILLEEIEKELLKSYNGNNIVICNPIYGYKLYDDFTLNYCEYEKIALGMGVISNKKDISILHDHTKLKQIYEKKYDNSIQILEKKLMGPERLYVYNRHNISHSFNIDKKEKTFYDEEILKEFGITKTQYFQNFKRQ
ncbi:hypothetical protein EOM09_07165 [bacterium]|nr:hypothetical protein [bacterium]